MNNIGLILFKQEKWNNLIVLCDQVLTHEEGNFKALLRKTRALIEVDDMIMAEKNLQLLTEIGNTSSEKKEIASLTKKYRAKEIKEGQFAKKAASKSLYTDKKDFEIPKAPVDPNIDQEELKELEKMSNFQWLLYPFLKAAVMLMKCQKPKRKRN